MLCLDQSMENGGEDSGINLVQLRPLQTLITAHGEIDHNTYFDPKTKQSFEFDHLGKEVSNMQDYDGTDQEAEPWR